MFRIISSFLLVSLWPILALASLKRPACWFGDTGPTPVVYFGGYKSTSDQTKAWAASAQSNPRYATSFKFEGHSLEGAASNKSSVIQYTGAHIANCVERINAPGFKGPVVLVGHSDGAWVINEIVHKVEPKNRHKIKLVNLDGYASKGSDFANVDVQCWTAYNKDKQATAPKDCKSIAKAARSLYTHEMANCKGGCNFIAESGCASNWCLHFRTMNKNAPANLGNGNYDTQGYLRVEPPLQYLNQFLSTLEPIPQERPKEIDTAT